MSSELDAVDEPEVRGPARIVSVHADGLVGRSKPVTLELADDHPVLLTGSSGSGKSTLLRSIHAVATGNFPLLASLPVAALRLERDDAPEIFTQRDGTSVTVVVADQSWTYHAGDAEPDEAEDDPWRTRGLPRLLRMEGAVTTRIAYEALIRYYNEKVRTEAPWIVDQLADLSVPYVADDRLFALAEQDVPSPVRPEPRARGFRPTATVAANSFRSIDLVEISLRSLCRDRALLASRRINAIDRDLPDKVIAAVRGEDASPEQVAERIEAIEKLQTRLDEFGLGGARRFATALPDGESGDRERAVLLAVLDSYFAKLSTSTPLLEDLERFVNAINRRFRRKRLVFTVKHGLLVVPDQAGSQANPTEMDEGTIPLGMLSSGEQHLVVLLYRLIFGSPSGSLFLIDEPELSLHVAWQRELASDLAEIAVHKQSRYLIATHSPSVIAGHLTWEINFDDLDG